MVKMLFIAGIMSKQTYLQYFIYVKFDGEHE